jgi:hypothetical protein
MRSRIPRREFLLRALAASGTPIVLGPVASAGAAGLQDAVPAVDDPVSDGPRRALRYVGEKNLEAAQAIGRARLRALGVGQTPAEIMSAAATMLERLRTAPNTRDAVEALVESVRQDFAEGRTIDVEGWILSPTEVEVCILTLLPQPA